MTATPVEPARPVGIPSHVQILSTATPEAFPAEWFDISSSDHFWFQWRWRVLWRTLQALKLDTHAPARAFDIGCGTGILRDQIEQHTAWTVDGADLLREALVSSRPGRGVFYHYDIFDRNPDFIGAYNHVFLFDVLEHIQEPHAFLECVLEYVKPGGLLFVNVPALECLRSPYDAVAGHHRRYTVSLLRQAFAGQPVTIERAVYWGFSLVPLLAVRKLFNRKMTDPAAILRSGFHPPAPFINRTLQALGALESTLFRRPPAGTSVLMAIRRNGP